MSHTITITASHIKYYVDICDALENEIKNQIEKTAATKYYKEFNFNEILKNLSELRKNLESEIGKPISRYNLSTLSKYEKECSNIKYFINSKRNEILDNIINSTEFDFARAIKNYGTMAYEALEQMNSKNIQINNDNFENTINEIRNAQISENKRKEFINYSYSLIDTSELPDDMKLLLKQEIRNIKSQQEMSDVAPLIESKINENRRIKSMIKDLNRMLANQGFSIDKDSPIIKKVDEYSNIVYKYVMKNSSNNKVSIIIDSEGKIKYKLGNYHGHMCNKTTEKLIEQLKKENYNISILSIKRDIGNNRPLAMERELK